MSGNFELALGMVPLVVICAALLVLPTVLAFRHAHRHKWLILALNVFGAVIFKFYTGLGFAALAFTFIWASSGVKKGPFRLW